MTAQKKWEQTASLTQKQHETMLTPQQLRRVAVGHWYVKALAGLFPFLMASPPFVLAKLPPVPDDSTIVLNIAAHQEKMMATELTEFEESRLPAWLRLIPSVSVQPVIERSGGFTLAPSVSVSLSRFIDAAQESRDRDNKRSAIFKKYHLETGDAIDKARSLRHEAIEAEKAIRFEQEKLQVISKLFELDSLGYANKTIPPDQFYSSKLRLISAKQAVSSAVANYLSKLSALLTTAKIPTSE
jgi:hypothetical protein